MARRRSLIWIGFCLFTIEMFGQKRWIPADLPVSCQRLSSTWRNQRLAREARFLAKVSEFRSNWMRSPPPPRDLSPLLLLLLEMLTGCFAIGETSLVTRSRTMMPCARPMDTVHWTCKFCKLREAIVWAMQICHDIDEASQEGPLGAMLTQRLSVLTSVTRFVHAAEMSEFELTHAACVKTVFSEPFGYAAQTTKTQNRRGSLERWLTGGSLWITQWLCRRPFSWHTKATTFWRNRRARKTHSEHDNLARETWLPVIV